ncbi:helix-turn-helix transcriptional regulator [Shimia sp. R9_1]|uniref:helix-turn-helix transcriptional regulator n=1 Tax=Shimia sp. R9_1 TaxID=2821111 RepID=UPI001ADCCE22|nr:helix-turn-helix transcriptional regulator [Shimia sp. R9_1]MBO9397464.1 helix-turn-helix transcriptional regulator [Shimia sp. R9_2]MBO9408575.1 helix-turn-helix transcriptional regulator [Shimia sp. R9_1]
MGLPLWGACVKSSGVLLALLALQSFCALFFLFEILASILGIRSVPIPWHVRELLEIGAALGLLLGAILGAVALRQAFRARARAEANLAQVQKAFREHIDASFAHWELTPAERDVALFSIKGLSIQEIAGLRETSEGTVKAQCNAIYRKAGVSGRAQLMSLFLDDLLAEEA